MKTKWLATFALFTLLFECVLAAGDIPPLSPPPGHPRVLLRPGDLAELRRAGSDPAVAAVWAELRRRAEIPADYQPGGRHDPALVRAAEANAFLSLARNDPQVARRAIELVFRYLDETLPFARKANDTRMIGHGLFVLAEVYDWCFDHLTADEKSRLVAAVPAHAKLMEIGFPPLGQSVIVGHAGEAQLFRDLLAVGIAMFDEEPSYYRVAADRIYNRFAPSRNFTYEGHFHHQGHAYGLYRFARECWAALLLTRMGASPPFNLSDMSRTPYWLLYMRRPDGGLIQDGDDYQRNDFAPGVYWHQPSNDWGLFAGLFRNPRFADEWRRTSSHMEPVSAALDDPVLLLLLRPDQVPLADAREPLPVTDADAGPSGTALVVLTDLEAGDCAVWRDDKIAQLASVPSEAHTLAFHLPPGRYRIEQRR